MAIGTGADFKIYEDEVQLGLWEGLSQIVDGFNAASGGAIRLIARESLGQYQKQAFFKSITNLITRRDVTVTTSATAVKMSQDEFISAKVNRKVGPVDHTLDAWRKIMGGTGEEAQRAMSFTLGTMIAEERAKDLINTAILCIEAAIEGQTSANYDATGQTTKTLTHTHLNSGLAKFGDFQDRIGLIVMHSKPFNDLIANAISENIFQVGGAAIIEGVPATFGRRVLRIDAPALFDDNGSLTDTYNTLGLVEDAVIVYESEEQFLHSEIVSGLENLVYRVQGEYAFNVQCKGVKWDTANGGANPTDTTLGVTTNWDLAVSHLKLTGGIRVKTQ